MFLEQDIKEYLVQVTIIEARHIVGKDETTGLSNPFVKIRIGKSAIQSTQVINACATPVWNQSFTFTNLQLNEQEFQTGELMIEMHSKNRFFGNDLIGNYSIGLSTLYKNTNHEYFNVWLTLSNPEYPDEAQGYLLVDCFIIRAGDRPPVHSINDKVNQDAGEEDEIDLESLKFDELQAYQEKKQGLTVLGKPSVARKAFQLSCFIFKAENLCYFPGVLGKVKPSSFISVRTVGLVNKTKTIGTNSSPVYNQKILFPAYLPFLNDKIVMRIWNSNSRAADDFIGNIPEFSGPNDCFNISKMLSVGGRMAAIWINLYCIPPDERNNGMFSKKKHPKIGTYFMGKVLLAFFLLPNPNPCFGVMPCNMMSDPPSQTYKLYADIYEIKYLKNYDILVWCDVNIGGNETFNKKMKVRSTDSVEWKSNSEINEISLPQIMQIFPCDVNQIPDIIISLYTGADKYDSRRIGFIRLKAEDVLKYEHTPRWLHFSPIDLNFDSPGSILINLQFAPDSNSLKRILKEKGLDKKFRLYTHVISGLDLDPTNKEKTKNTYTVEIFMDSNSITNLKGIKMNTVKIKDENQIGDNPFWNRLNHIDTDLDLKLDFAPDVLVKLKNDEEIVGNFTVPIYSIRKKNDNDYPHYFNFIKNNQIVGRVLMMLYIIPAPTKVNHDKEQALFKLYKKLQVKKRVTVKVFIHGVRDMDFNANFKKCNLQLKILSTNIQENKTLNYVVDGKKKKEKKEQKPKDQENINNTKETEEEKLQECNEPEDLNYLNVCQVFEFETVVYGDPKALHTNDDDDVNLALFPYLEIKLVNTGFFSNTERFLLLDLNDHYPGFSEKTRLRYKHMFEKTLGIKSIDQPQSLIDIKATTIKNQQKKKKEDEDEEFNDEEKLLLFGDNNKEEINFKKKTEKKDNEKKDEKEQPKSVTQKEINDFIVRCEKFDYHKFMDISTEETLCLKEDKEKERAAKKKMRKEKKAELDELRRQDDLTQEDIDRLLKLQDEIRELKKPLMGEGMFYGFEDVSDDYDYGTEVYKDDIYEGHPNMQIPYKEKKMMYIPAGFFDEKCHDIGGYYKLGRESTTNLKFRVDVKVHDDEDVNKPQENKKTKKKELSNEIDHIKNEAEEEEYIKKKMESVDVFNEIFCKKLRNIYLTKDNRKKVSKDDIILPLNNLKVRIYIFRCLNLTAQENSNSIVDNLAGYSAFCKANSFIEIKLGYDNDQQKGVKYLNDLGSLVESTLNPHFFKYYELDADLPQDWRLQINIKSKGTAGENLIGSTIVDLENRYLGEKSSRIVFQGKSLEEEYKNLLLKLASEENADEEEKNQLTKRIAMLQVKMKENENYLLPVEFRPLFKPGISTAQGIIEMMVEVLPMKVAKLRKPLKIEPPPAQEYELRLVIWETRNVYMMGKKTLSLFFKCTYDPEGWLSEPIEKETDVHNGLTDGNAEYNWRMKFPIKIPCTFPRINFQGFNFNVVGGDELVGETYVSLKRVFKKLLRQGELTLDKKWIPLATKNDNADLQGEVCISIYFVPQDIADAKPVGEAQDEPNRDPKLKKPTKGRGIGDFLAGSFLDFSFNFDLFGNLKLLALLGSVVTVFIILFVSPGILTQ